MSGHIQIAEELFNSLALESLPGKPSLQELHRIHKQGRTVLISACAIRRAVVLSRRQVQQVLEEGSKACHITISWVVGTKELSAIVDLKVPIEVDASRKKKFDLIPLPTGSELEDLLQTQAKSGRMIVLAGKCDMCTKQHFNACLTFTAVVNAWQNEQESTRWYSARRIEFAELPISGVVHLTKEQYDSLATHDVPDFDLTAFDRLEPHEMAVMVAKSSKVHFALFQETDVMQIAPETGGLSKDIEWFTTSTVSLRKLIDQKAEPGPIRSRFPRSLRRIN